MNQTESQQKKINLLKNMPVSKALLAMGIPTMIGMMINAIYNIVDAYFVGKLGTSEMGAISVSFPISQVIVGFGLLFGNGGGSYISRLLGKGDTTKAEKVASTSLYCALCVGLFLVALSQIFLNPILKGLGATSTILPYATTYGRICFAACLFNLFNVLMNNIVTSEGSPKTTMMALLCGAVLNMILDPIFIFTLKLGVMGAAIATAISQMISSIIYIIYILKKKSLFSFSIKKWECSSETMKEIFKIGIPTLFFQLLTSLAIMLVNTQANKYGDSAIAAMGATTRIISMGSLMVFGFIKGFQPIAGFSYGAKLYKRLSEAIKISVLWSTIFCVLYGTICAIFSKQVISLFTTYDEKMIFIGQKALVFNGLSFMLFGFFTVYSSLLLSMGKGRAGFIVGALRQGICFIPAIFILPHILGLDGIIFAQPIADIIASLCTVFVAIGINKEIRSIQLS
jgi:putative MATE family efflux protein